MRFPWTRSRDATTAELAEQREHAKAAHDAAQAAIGPAQVAFDDSGDDGAAKVLSKAREAEQHAQLHVARAQRLLEAAQARDTATARRADEARLGELEALLANPAVSAAVAPLDDHEASLLLQLATVRAERIKLADDFDALGVEREQVLARLNRQGFVGIAVVDGVARTGRPRGFQGRPTILSRTNILASLTEELHAIDRADPRAEMLAEIVTALGGDGRIPSRREMFDAEFA